MTNKVNSVLLPASVLLITFQSFYLQKFGFSPAALLGWMLFLALLGSNAWRKKQLWSDFRDAAQSKLWLFAQAAILISGGVGYWNSAGDWNSKVWIAFLIIFGSLPLAKRAPLGSLRNGLLLAIGVHLTAFYVQWMSYLIDPRGGRLDFLYWFTGENQRFYSTDTHGVIRPTGFFNEPSTYGLFITVLMLLLFELDRRKFGKWTRLSFALSFLVLMSLFLSFSVLGWVSAGVLLVSFTFGKEISRSFRGYFLAGVLTVCSLLLLSAPDMRLAAESSLYRLKNFTIDYSFRERIYGEVYGSAPKYRERKSLLSVSHSGLGEGLGNYTQVKSSGMGALYYLDYLGVLCLPLLLFVFLTFKGVVDRLILLLFFLHAPYVQHPFFSMSLLFLGPQIGALKYRLSTEQNAEREKRTL